MKRIVLKYGLISGIGCAVMMGAATSLESRVSLDYGYLIGYTLIVLSFVLVFFGIRTYREKDGGGEITFVKAFTVGIGITLITCVFYVAAWEIIYINFTPDFADKYAEHVVAKARSAGKSDAEIQALVAQMNKFRQDYKNPVYNSAMTFLEPFPVGVAITLLSAVILRRRAKPQASGEPLPARN